MNMHFYRKLPIPMDIKEQFPITHKTEKRRIACVNQLKEIFSRKSNKPRHKHYAKLYHSGTAFTSFLLQRLGEN